MRTVTEHQLGGARSGNLQSLQSLANPRYRFARARKMSFRELLSTGVICFITADQVSTSRRDDCTREDLSSFPRISGAANTAGDQTRAAVNAQRGPRGEKLAALRKADSDTPFSPGVRSTLGSGVLGAPWGYPTSLVQTPLQWFLWGDTALLALCFS